MPRVRSRSLRVKNQLRRLSEQRNRLFPIFSFLCEDHGNNVTSRTASVEDIPTEEDLEVVDRLPSRLRELLWDLNVDFASYQVERLWKDTRSIDHVVRETRRVELLEAREFSSEQGLWKPRGFIRYDSWHKGLQVTQNRVRLLP